jgi:hypothetical protein
MSPVRYSTMVEGKSKESRFQLRSWTSAKEQGASEDSP